MLFRILRFVSVFLGVASVFCSAQDLDQQAWQTVNDRLATYLPAQANYKVHFPPSAMFALWSDQNSIDALSNLMTVGDTIPPWAPSWLSGGGSVSDRYGLIIDNIDYPKAPGVTEAQKNAALKEYDKAVKALDATVKQLGKELENERKGRQARGIPFTLMQQQAWWSQHAGVLSLPAGKFQTAVLHVQQTQDPNWQLRQAWDSFRIARTAAAQNQLVPGYFPYDGNSASLQQLLTAGKTAETNQACTTGWDLNKTNLSQTTSHLSFGGSASYGPFISVSGGSSTFTDVLSGDGTHIAMHFCSIGFIPIQPGTWYTNSVLTLLKQNAIKIRSGAVLPPNLFGEGGWLSRIPVGVIAAYKPTIVAKMSTTYSSTFEQTWSGTAGIGIGPFQIGGSAGGSRKETKVQNADGSYSIVGVSDYPYIIAVVSREVP